MDAKDLGVVPVEDEVKTEVTDDEVEDGQHSDETKGTGEDADATPEGDVDEDTTDPKDERINNLMSKWQSAESSHNKTKSELDTYKNKFGAIDAEPQATDDLPESLKEGWQPRTVEDIQKGMRESAEYGAKSALGTIAKTEQNRKSAEEAVDGFITEVKTADPEFDEKEFYKYANQHNFPVKGIQDLRSVYSSYHGMQKAISEASKRAVINKEKRNDTVNKPGAGGAEGGSINYKRIHGANSATDLINDMLNQ